MSNLSDKLQQLRRPPRQDRPLFVLFLLVNAAILGLIGMAYLLYRWLDTLPQH